MHKHRSTRRSSVRDLLVLLCEESESRLSSADEVKMDIIFKTDAECSASAASPSVDRKLR